MFVKSFLGGKVMNVDVRLKAVESGVRLWQVAQALGITDGSFSRKLRTELSDEEKTEIFSVIKSIAERKGQQ